jgi:RNA polymerase sigma-70 factor (ECF subfamily)
LSRTGQKDREALPLMKVNAGPANVRQPGPALSFAEVFREHARPLWRALLGLGVRPGDVDDACQEVFLVVHRRLPEFDGRALRSWLYAICLRVASEYRRSARVRREITVEEVPEDAAPPLQLDLVATRELSGRLLASLERLDEEKRQAFVLYEVEELTLREVAEALGCPLQTAYSRLQAARTFVRADFERNAP